MIWKIWGKDSDLVKRKKDPWIHLNPDSPGPSILGNIAIDPLDPPPVYRLMERIDPGVDKRSSWEILLSTPDLVVAIAYRRRLVETEAGYSYANLEIWPMYTEEFGEGNYGSD